jgi:hypothetical protein
VATRLDGNRALAAERWSWLQCSLRRGRKGRKLASKDVVDSNTIRGWQALPLVHFLLPRLHVAISLAPAGDEPDGERFYWLARLPRLTSDPTLIAKPIPGLD